MDPAVPTSGKSFQTPPTNMTPPIIVAMFLARFLSQNAPVSFFLTFARLAMSASTLS
jgi:hypothetical protein